LVIWRSANCCLLPDDVGPNGIWSVDIQHVGTEHNVGKAMSILDKTKLCRPHFFLERNEKLALVQLMFSQMAFIYLAFRLL
jgi:hypothetical protein